MQNNIAENKVSSNQVSENRVNDDATNENPNNNLDIFRILKAENYLMRILYILIQIKLYWNWSKCFEY